MWSKLVKTPFGENVLKLYDRNKLAYHNREHVLYLYEYLKKYKVKYSSALDFAVLFHDVVYDAKPDKELRSAYLMSVMCEANGVSNKLIKATWDLIMATSDHIVKDESTLEIIKADLYGLTDEITVIENFAKIQREGEYLYPSFSFEDRVKGTKAFMMKFKDTMGHNMDYDAQYFSKVYRGIGLTIKLCEVLE